MARISMGRFGAEGRFRSCGRPENVLSASVNSSTDASRSSSIKTASVWPSMTGTRVHSAVMPNVAFDTVPLARVPSSFFGSISIFCSSFPM